MRYEPESHRERNKAKRILKDILRAEPAKQAYTAQKLIDRYNTVAKHGKPDIVVSRLRAALEKKGIKPQHEPKVEENK